MSVPAFFVLFFYIIFYVIFLCYFLCYFFELGKRVKALTIVLFYVNSIQSISRIVIKTIPILRQSYSKYIYNC